MPEFSKFTSRKQLYIQDIRSQRANKNKDAQIIAQ